MLQVNGFDTATKIANIFIKSQENLSSTRFIQDTATNWAPKAVFSRSKEDFAEMSFLEFLESAIFYFASPILGEKLLRNKVFKNFQPKNLKDVVNSQIPKSVEEITKDKSLTQEVKKSALNSKAGIVLALTAIPVAEYTLSFAKNLFTLKTFNKSNFNNIANLNKKNGEKEDKLQQEKVEKHSKHELKKGAIVSALGLAGGICLGLFGKKFDKSEKLSRAILEPGKVISKGITKAGIKNEKLNKFIQRFSLDFANNNGKLALSKGQLGLTALVGLFGYSKAARDRGKLDFLEVWTRVPLVVFYTTFGSELFEKGFINLLNKKNKFPNLLKRNSEGKLFVPHSKKLPEIAQNLAKTNKTLAQDELSKLIKQKAFVTAVPYAFSLLFMGFTLSAITRFWTQYRYNHSKNNDKSNYADTLLFTKNKLPEQFNAFSKS